MNIDLNDSLELKKAGVRFFSHNIKNKKNLRPTYKIKNVKKEKKPLKITPETNAFKTLKSLFTTIYKKQILIIIPTSWSVVFPKKK